MTKIGEGLVPVAWQGAHGEDNLAECRLHLHTYLFEFLNHLLVNRLECRISTSFGFNGHDRTI